MIDAVELEALPDLSDWIKVEVVTLEEVGMLWAAIDPLDHEGVRLGDIFGVSFTQHRKAKLIQRAVVEAVCSGTLPFESAWEERSDWRSVKVEFPDLPDASVIAPHLTRVKLAAVMRWAKSKEIRSYREIVGQKEAQRKAALAAVNVVAEPVETDALQLPFSRLRDPNNSMSPLELRVAMDVWEATQAQAEGPDGIEGITVKQAATRNLELHPDGKNLPTEAKKRVTTVVNWNQKGGAPKTPGN